MKGLTRVSKVLLVGGLSILIGIGSLASFAEPALAAEKILKIGDITPLSGSAAAYGIPHDRGIKMCAEDWNAKGGVKVGKDRYKIEIVTMENRYMPADSLAAAKSMVDKGIRFVHTMGGGTMPAMQPFLERNKVIFMGNAAGGKSVTNAKYPYTFRVLVSGDVTQRMVYPTLVKKWRPFKLGIAGTNDDTGRSMAAAAKTTIKELDLPIKLLAVEFYEGDATDLTPGLLRMKAAGVDAIEVCLRATQGFLIVKQLHELGYKPHLFTSTYAYTVEGIIKTAGVEAAEGFTQIRVWPRGQGPTKMFDSIVDRYEKRHGELPFSTLANDAYNGLEFMLHAIQKAGTLDTERVVKVMYDLRVDTSNGKDTHMVGETIGYGIKTQIAYTVPLTEIVSGKPKVIAVMNYTLE
ncbi:MAG: ABC transporter substrate-binding protein [Candidatus Hodarchaeota archaeon]